MSLIAVDIGNTRIKLGLFAARAEANGLPTPSRTLVVPTLIWDEASAQNWLRDVPSDTAWWIASVNRAALSRLTTWIQQNRAGTPKIRRLKWNDLPITAAVEFPDKVGIDRLAGAVAANRLRDPVRPAIVIGVGSAITVDLVGADGVFRGGAILPGIGMSARALDEFTDLLPRSPLEELTGPPPALGTSTLSAIHSGLYWGAVGAMRELVARLSQTLSDENVWPEVFLTGGAAASVAATLDPATRFVEHLVLAGIALAKPEVNR
jgi:type III pantothenate kinase